MQDENKKQNEQSHIFKVHTMASDSNFSSKSKQNKKTLNSVLKNKHENKNQSDSPFMQNEVEGNGQNPFLSDADKTQDLNNTKKNSFAPGAQKEIPGKINQSSSDIVRSKPKPVPKQKDSKKLMHTLMLIFILIFLLGAAGFGVYLLKFNTPKTSDTQQQKNNISNETKENNGDNSTIKETELPNDDADSEMQSQQYSVNLPNYLSIDTESQNSQQEIRAKLNTIAQNMQEDGLIGPFAFVVTDKNNNPVSFHIFAMSAGMDIPQDILSSLEENFELYAYNDELNGVRFGLAVDVKNVDSLRTAMKNNEKVLPKAFDIILRGNGSAIINAVFRDGSYGTYPIRYYNLDEEGNYSIDYTIANQKLLLGTTKETMRAIIDTLKNSQSIKNSNL